MPKTPSSIRLVIATLLLLAAACGDSGDATTTTAAQGAVGSTQTTTTSTIAESATTTTSPVTTEAPTTTVAAATTVAPTTTVAGATTTSTVDAGDAAAAAARTDAKVNAVIAAAPEGWDAFVEESTVEGGGNDVVFGPCTAPGDFDLDNLEASSFGAKSAVVSEPTLGGPFPGPESDIEVRVFHSEAIAEDAFGVLERVLGTDEGRECMGQQFLGLIQAPAGTDFSLSAGPLDVPGADVGTRLTVGFEVQGIDGTILVDLVAARQGDTTIFAGFQAFDAGFPADVAAELFGAALSG